jgi:hypothetical protein
MIRDGMRLASVVWDDQTRYDSVTENEKTCLSFTSRFHEVENSDSEVTPLKHANHNSST